MKRLQTCFLLISLMLFSVSILPAQVCTPDPACTQAEIICGDLNNGCEGEFYSSVITIALGNEISGFTLIDVTLNSFTGLPSGLGYECNPANCVVDSSSSGCILIEGIPDVPGTYNLIANVTARLFIGFVISIDTALAVGEIVIEEKDCNGDCGGTAAIDACGICSGGNTGLLPDCDDGDICTENLCDGLGGCLNPPVECDDFDPCTVDSCDPVFGCLNEPIDCDDNDVCTADFCNGGFCFNIQSDCDDGDPCTDDSCDPVLGCIHEPVNCDDGDPCTYDYCNNGLCVHENECIECGQDTLYRYLRRANGITDVLNIIGSPGIANGTNDITKELGNNYELIFDSAAVKGAFVWFTYRDIVGSPDSFRVNIYEVDVDGIPLGVPLAFKSISSSAIIPAVFLANINYVEFDNPVKVYGNFAVTVEVGNQFGQDDTIAIAMNLFGDGQGEQRAIMRAINDVWFLYDDVWTVNGNPVDIDFMIFPVLEVDCVDDGDPCTEITCVNNECITTQVVCDDGNLCTDDTCDSSTGCVFTPIDCDDSDPCTDDFCDPLIGCINDPLDCDDNDPCTTDFCDNGICENEEIIGCNDPCLLVDCDDNDPCTVDSCDNGICLNEAIDCDDNDPCTDDSCDNGICQNELLDCDDNDPCTDDFCDTGICINEALDCDDNDPCTDDSCDNGICQNEPLDCDDNDPCTDDVCVNGFCENNPLDCDDNDPCTVDVCDNGICVNTLDKPQLAFDVPDVCSGDSILITNNSTNVDPDATYLLDLYSDGVINLILPASALPVDSTLQVPLTGDIDFTVYVIQPNGCSDTLTGAFNALNCDDNDPCTIDSCAGLTCFNTQIDCDDGDPCTIDFCDNGVCVHLPDYPQLAFGVPDVCSGDNILITNFSTNVDSNAIYELDLYSNGTIDLTLPASALPVDSTLSVPLSGNIDFTVYVTNPNSCADTLTDSFIALDCDDNDPCTVDDCTNAVCSNVPLDCDDNDLCTDDYCDNGTCFNDPINCDDGDPCTDDSCDPLIGCINTPKDCDDSDPCTVDICNGGACQNPPLTCSDGDPCTDDICDNGACVFVPNGCVFDNDLCVDAVTITTGFGIPFNMVGKTTDGVPDIACVVGGSGQLYSDVWYEFTPVCDGDATINLTMSGDVDPVDPRIAIYLAPCPGVLIACSDSNSNDFETITWAATSGTTYLIRIGGYSLANQDSGTFDLIITDLEVPIIACPANQSLDAELGVCIANVISGVALASDNCGYAVVTNNITGTADASGVYPFGNNDVVWTATDIAGNTATCTQVITITDIEAPQITCPPSQTVDSDAGLCLAAVMIPAPTTSDNCSVAGVVNDFNNTANASDDYPVGNTTVIWTVTDGSGNSATCVHDITVEDNEQPAITCPADVFVSGCQNIVTVPTPTVSDNCSVDSFINDFNNTADASDDSPIGSTAVVWTVSDIYGNTNTCSMNVVRSSPIVASITPIPAEACALTDVVLQGNPVPGLSPIVSHKWTGPGLVGVTNLDSVIVNIALAGTFGPIIYTATDADGCTGADTINLTVLGNPSAILVPDVKEICEGESFVFTSSVIGGNGAISLHEWTGDTSPLTNTNLPQPGFDGNIPGSYLLTYTVTDAKGCKGSDNITVIVNSNPVLDIQPVPAEVCQFQPFSLSVNELSGSGVIISRNWTGNTTPLSSTTSATPNFNTDNAGIFNLTYSVTDSKLCSASENVTVTVFPEPVVSFSGLTATYCLNDDADSLFGTPSGGSFSGPGITGVPVTRLYQGANTTVSGNTTNIFSQSVTVPGTVLGNDIILKRICFNVAHPSLQDLQFILEAPGGNFVVLASFLCGAQPDIDVCIVPGTINNIDNATCNAIAPTVQGTFNAGIGNNLDDLNNGFTNPNGNWQLYIDNFNPANGLLTDWSLEFEYLGQKIFNPLEAGVGTHIITYNYTDGNNCSKSASSQVTVNPVPVADAGVDTEICSGESTTLSATGGSIFDWSTGETTASITVSPLVNTTYTVVVSNTFGCEDAASVSVDVNALPTANFSGLDAEYCENDAPSVLTGLPAGGNFSGPGVTTTGSGVSTVAYAGAPVPIPDSGQTEVDVNVSGVGNILGADVTLEKVCFKIQHSWVEDLDITLIAPNGATIIFAEMPCGIGFQDLDVCVVPGTGNSINNAVCSFVPPALTGDFNASLGDDLNDLNNGSINPNGTWQLSISDNFAGDTGELLEFSLQFNSTGLSQFNPAAAGPGNHAVTYVYSDQNSCSDTVTIQTLVIASPVAVAQPDTAICPGEIVMLTASGGTSYQWITGDMTDEILVSPFSTNTYSVTVSDASGCSAEADVTVTVFTPPTADAGVAQTICPSTTATLTATGGVSYVWNTGDATASVNVSPATNSTFNVTVTDANGCTATDDVTVSLFPAAVAVAGPDEDICVGGSVSITASGGDFYFWSDGVNTSITGTRPASPLATTVYTVTVEDNNGCTDVAALTVTVHPFPVIDLSGISLTYCETGADETLTPLPAGGTLSGVGVSGNTFSPTSVSPGNYIIRYQYADAFGCGSVDSVTVTVISAPPANFTGLAPEYCEDTTRHLLTGIPAGGTFSGPGISNNVFVSFFAGPGTHNITYAYSTGGGCSGIATQSVIVHAEPVVSISGLNAVFCSLDNPVTLTGVPAGGVFSGTGISGNTFNPPDVTFSSPVVVGYHYVDGNGCEGETREVVTVHSNPQAVILVPGVLCTGQTSVPLTGSPAGGTFSGPGISNNNITPSAAGVGTHTIQYTVSNLSGCSSTASLQVTVNATPVVSFSGLNASHCVNAAPITLTGNPAGGTFSGTGTGGNAFIPELAGSGGPYNVTYSYTAPNGCTGTDTKQTTVLNAPFITISGLKSVYCIYESPETITAFPAGGTFIGSGVSNGVFNPRAAGIGTHAVGYLSSNSNGCSEFGSVLVTVDACVGIEEPDAVRSVSVYPNPTEGKFMLDISGKIEAQTNIRIYDVTGKVVFEKTVLEQAHDYLEEINLADFSKGVYVLQINFRDGVVTKKVVVQ